LEITPRERAARAAELRQQLANLEADDEASPEVVNESGRQLPEPFRQSPRRTMAYPPDYIPGDIIMPYDITREINEELAALAGPGQILLDQTPWHQRVRIIPAGAEDDSEDDDGNQPDMVHEPVLPPLDPVAVNRMLENEIRDEPAMPIMVQDDPEDDQDSVIGNCRTCIDKKVNCAYLPCGHAIYCVTCAKTVRQMYSVCSICKRQITGILRLIGAEQRSQPNGIDVAVQTDPGWQESSVNDDTKAERKSREHFEMSPDRNNPYR
jgi:hypothetical protein